jgi:hypothetical protein
MTFLVVSMHIKHHEQQEKERDFTSGISCIPAHHHRWVSFNRVKVDQSTW